MADKEIVLVNKSKGRFTINFQGAFPQNKTAAKDGKFYLSAKEYDYVRSTFPQILEGENQRLYREGKEPITTGGASGPDEMKAFFEQHHTKVKSAISQMDDQEAQAKLNYAQLNEVSEPVIKALGDRILELDKTRE